MNTVFPPWPIREFRDRSDGIPESEREDSIFRGAGRFSGAQIENNSHRQSLQWQSGRGPDDDLAGRGMKLADLPGRAFNPSTMDAGFFGAIHY